MHLFIHQRSKSHQIAQGATSLTALNFFQKTERFLINETCQQEIAQHVPDTVIQKT